MSCSYPVSVQVELACKVGKPLFVHDREAHAHITECLDRFKGRLPPVVIHCFTGTPAEAQRYVRGCVHWRVHGPVSMGCIVEYGMWGVECGVWDVECGVWDVGCIVWSVGCGVWGVGCGVWSVECGMWDVECGVWSVGCGMYSVECGVWVVGCIVWSVGCGVWSVECGEHSFKKDNDHWWSPCNARLFQKV